MNTRILSLVLALMMVPAVCFAEWQGNQHDVGRRYKHRNAVSSADTWMATGPTSFQSEARDLSGYDHVRADFDVSGVSVVANLQCSNDAIWVSGDSITVTRDSSKSWPLTGCNDYYVYVESVSGSGAVTVYLTPYNN